MNKERKLFLGERLGEPGIWQLPQGGVDRQFPLAENALREAEEETGIPRSQITVIKQFNATHEYEFERPPDYAREKWRGQSQTFWLLEFLGSDSIINLNHHEPEFSAWCWCTVEELKKKVEPKRLPGYLNALKEFEQFLTEARNA